MEDFKNRVLGLINNGVWQTKSILDNFNEIIDSFDAQEQIDYFNEKKNALMKKCNDLFSGFNELLEQVKEDLTDFSVTVPFDESIGEKIAYKVENGKLEIVVSYADETQTKNNKTVVLIPSNCDLEQMKFSTNSTKKTATISIPKKIGEHVKKCESKKTSKKRSKYDKILKRDAKGRFVRRNPKTNAD